MPPSRSCPFSCSDSDTTHWLLAAGYDLETFTADMGKFWHHITGDSQLRWIGPDKGAIHLATGAVVNAVWDLYAKQVRTHIVKLRAVKSWRWPRVASIVGCVAEEGGEPGPLAYTAAAAA